MCLMDTTAFTLIIMDPPSTCQRYRGMNNDQNYTMSVPMYIYLTRVNVVRVALILSSALHGLPLCYLLFPSVVLYYYQPLS